MKSSPLKILVVDQHACDRMTLQALLAEPGTDVLCAASGPEALELLLQHDFAVALVDVQMPDMDGPQLVGLMHSSERTPLLPIIFVTALEPDPQRTAEGYKAGAVDFIYKPFEPLVLKSKVAVFLALHRQRHELEVRRRELERVVALNGLVIASLSHDIRTPLAALSLNAELMVRRAEGAPLQQAAQRVKTALTILSRQIDHLVNLAGLNEASMVPQPQPVDLPALLRQRLERANPGTEIGATNSLHVEGDAAISCDPRLITQAVDQLLLVLDGHRGQQPVSMHVDGHARRLLLLRLHTPAVLPEPVQEHLFSAVERGPGLAASRVGPGLQLVENIARSHGGSLIGRSSEREGTLFELMLPREGV